MSAHYTAAIKGRKVRQYATLGDVQRAIYSEVSGRVSGNAWYRAQGDNRGCAVRDDCGALVAFVSYNGRAWTIETPPTLISEVPSNEVLA